MRSGCLAANSARYRQETTKVYYQTVSKHLAPHSGLQSADVAALDARQRVVDAEFELRRYTAHSAFLWAAPPYSLAGLEVAICACTWYSGLLPETFDARTGALTSPSTPPVPFPLTHDKIISRKRSEPSLRAAAQTVAGDPDSLQSIKRSLSQTLSSLGRRKDQLEIAWAQREDQQGQLERHLQSLVEQYRHSRSLSTSASIGRMPGAESAWDISRLARGSATEKEKHKKGVGHRLRGMITSASQYGGLSSKARDSSAVHTPEPGPTELAKQSTRQSASGTSSAIHNALDNSTNASHAGTGSVLENGGYESPFRAVTRRPSSVQDSPLEEDVAVMPAALHPAPQRPTTAIRDLQMASGAQVAEDEMQRELAGRKREGLLWSPNTWEDIGGSSSRQMERKDRGRWDQFWVVLAASKIYEYRDGLNGKAQHPHEVIDLRFASAREGRDTDRRFTFEVVTPSRGKRMYQATSAEDMRSWIYAIGNAVQSCLNGTATLQARASPGVETVDDLVLSGGGHGTTVQMHSGLSSRALKGMSTPAGGISSGWHRQVGRRVSLKEALRQSKHSLGFDKSDKRPSTITVTADGEQDARQQLSRHTSRRRSRGSLGIPNPPFLGDTSRQSSNSSQTSSKRLSWMSNRSVSPSPPIDRPLLQTRGSSSQLEAYSKLAVLAASASNGPEWLTNSLANASADVSVPPDTTTLPSQADIAPADMIMLRKVADQPGNQICADCKRPIKGENSQRWATINLRGHPMVMFLCIRCAGVHRSLGTHISKVRSPDLDHWTDEMILTARAWGNARGNAIWERNKPENVKPADE